MLYYNLQFFGGRGSSSGGSGTLNAFNIPSSPTLQVAQAANNATFADDDQSPYHALYNGRQYFLDQNLTIDQQMAVINYLSEAQEPGSLYSISQNMNTSMANGIPLTANQQFVADQMNSAMHNLGYNLTLTRYDHPEQIDSMLSAVGLKGGYGSYSEAQLSKALVGTTFSESRFLSTSYNDFAKAADASKFTSRSVKITYRAKAKTQAMMPGNGPGGSFGEMVLAPGQTQKIVGVRYTGKKSRKKGSNVLSEQQVELIIEIG